MGFRCTTAYWVRQMHRWLCCAMASGPARWLGNGLSNCRDIAFSFGTIGDQPQNLRRWIFDFSDMHKMPWRLIEHLELDVHALMGWSMGVGVATWIAATLPHNPLLIFLSGCHLKPQRKILGFRAVWHLLAPGVALSAALPDPANQLLERLCERSVDLREQELLLLRPLCG